MHNGVTMKSILKPARLRKGDLVGIVAPGSPPSGAEKIERGVRYLEKTGFRVEVAPSVLKTDGYLAGPDHGRADDLNAMFGRDDVKGIFALRGGYGSLRILDRIDYDNIRRHPKVFVGYSDITALHLALFRKAGLVTFAGPMTGVEMADEIDPFTEEHFWRLVTEGGNDSLLQNHPDRPWTVMREGTGEGILLGGNLSVLVSLLGTGFFPGLEGSLLFLEDVDEPPYKIDRMLAQLRLAGVLASAHGLLLGIFKDCNADPDRPGLPLERILSEYMEFTRGPVVRDFLFGHFPQKLTIPVGIRARLDTTRGALELLESAVI